MQQATGRITPPAVRIFQCADEFFGRGRPEFRRFRNPEARWRESIDPASLFSTKLIDACDDFIRHRGWRFDDLAVHVQDVQRTVWSIDQIGRTKPVVC